MPCLWKFAVYCPNYSFSLCANVYCIYLQCTNSDLTTSDWFIYSSLAKWDSSWFSYKDKNRLSGYWSGASFIYKWFKLAFATKRDSATFQDKGTEVPSLSRDKGTTGQAKNLAKWQDGMGQPKSWTGRDGRAKIRDGTRDKTRQSRKGRSKTEKDVLKQKRTF